VTSARPSPDPSVWRVIPTPHVPSPRYKWVLLAVVGIAVTGFGSLMTLVTVSLDLIATDLDSTVLTALWLLTGLMLAMAVGTPLGGKISDALGHKRVFMTGISAMAVLLFLSAVAPNMGTLIGLRVLFGVAGAILMPSSMALIMHAFPVDERAKAVAYFQMAMTGGPTIGVVIGGPLIDVIGWRGIFVVFGVLSLVAGLVAAFVVKPVAGHGKLEVDILGTLLLAAGTLLILFAIIRVAAGTSRGDIPLYAMLGGSAACFAGFVSWELRAPAPLLDVRLFRRPSFVTPLVASACNQFAYMGAFVLVPQLLKGPYGFTEGVAALLMLPRPGLFSLASPIGGFLPGRIGFRIPMMLGTLMMLASMAAFAFGSGPGALWLVILGLSLSGISSGLSSPSYQTLVANSVDAKDLGIANGMSQTMLWIGIIMGIQSMGAMVGSDPTTRDYQLTFLFGGVVAAVGFIAPLLVGKRSGEETPGQ
jgi:MFS family permease